MKKKSILLFSFFILFVISSFSQSNLPEVKIKVIEKPATLESGLLFSMLENAQTLYFTYLTREKVIKFGYLSLDEGELIYKNLKDIYKYENEDVVNFLDIFFYNNSFYILHLEKFSYQLIMNYFYNVDNISKIEIIDTQASPLVFIDKNLLKIYYLKGENSIFTLNEFDLSTFKSKEFSGYKNTNSFSAYFDPISRNTITLWKQNNENNKIFISSMDKDYNGYSPIIELKFKQNIEIPKSYINDKLFNLAFMDSIHLKYISCPLTHDIRNSYAEKFPEIFNDYKIEEYINYRENNVVVFKKTVDAAQNKKIEKIQIGFFDKDFKYKTSFSIDDISGNVSNFKIQYFHNKTYIFWIDSYDNLNYIRFMVIDF
jgi:hypothetical protein